MIAAKARRKLVTVVAANAIRCVGNRLQRREDQCLVALPCLIAELRLGEPEDVDNVGAPRWKFDTVAGSVFISRGDRCLQAQALEVVLQIPFVQMSKTPVLSP